MRNSKPKPKQTQFHSSGQTVIIGNNFFVESGCFFHGVTRNIIVKTLKMKVCDPALLRYRKETIFTLATPSLIL